MAQKSSNLISFGKQKHVEGMMVLKMLLLGLAARLTSGLF